MQLLELNGTFRVARETAAQVAGQLRTANPSMPAQVWTRYTELVSNQDSLIELYVPIYARHLCDEDVAAVLGFYATDAGARWREVAPRIAAETAPVAQEFIASLALALGDEGGDAPTHAHGIALIAPDDKRAPDVARLLRASGALSQARAVMAEMLERIRKLGLAPDLRESIWLSAREKLTDERALLALWTPAYVKHLSSADVSALLAFYETPVGKRFVDAQAVILKESIEAATLLANRSARQAVKDVLGPLPQWRLQNPAASDDP